MTSAQAYSASDTVLMLKSESRISGLRRGPTVTTNLPTEPSRHGWADVLRLFGAVRQLASTAPCQRRRRWAGSGMHSATTTSRAASVSGWRLSNALEPPQQKHPRTVEASGVFYALNGTVEQLC
jgi:hypothetical protein